MIEGKETLKVYVGSKSHPFLTPHPTTFEE